MIVVWAREIPRSAIISTRSRKLSLNLRYQRTQRMMISRSKWRPLKRSSMLNMLGQLHRRANLPRVCPPSAICTRAAEVLRERLVELETLEATGAATEETVGRLAFVRKLLIQFDARDTSTATRPA